MVDNVPAVDVHAHVFVPEVQSMVEGRPGLAAHQELDIVRFGREALEVSRKSVADRYELLVDPAARTAEMDRTDIDVQVVSVSPTQYHFWADRSLAEDLAQATNEAVAAHCATRPDRLTGLGVVPLQHPDAAVAALEHAVLTCGLRGVEISSHALEPDGAGVIDLSDRRLEPLWQRAAELGVVVFIHPWGCTLDARLDSWYMGNTVGQPVEHAVALSHLILSGVLDRHPGLRVIAGHGGGYLPTCMSRADFAWIHRVDARGCERLPSSYLQQLWFDSLVYTPQALRALVAVTGPDRVVLGSDYPFDMGVDDAVRRLEDAAFEPDIVRAIKGGNASTLGLLPS